MRLVAGPESPECGLYFFPNVIFAPFDSVCDRDEFFCPCGLVHRLIHDMGVVTHDALKAQVRALSNKSLFGSC